MAMGNKTFREGQMIDVPQKQSVGRGRASGDTTKAGGDICIQEIITQAQVPSTFPI